MEVWKDIEGYEGLYQISNLGRVKSFKAYGHSIERILSPGNARGDYLHIGLMKNHIRKMYMVHRLVAEAFLPNPEGKSQVDHINGIRDDNRVSNLRWCTSKENINFPLSKKNHAVANKKRRAKSVLCVETGVIYSSLNDACNDIGMNHGNLSSALRGRQKRCGGYHWEYVN